MTVVKLALLSRRLGRRLSFGGRFLVPLRIFRRLFAKATGSATIDDFDGDFRITLKLSEHMQRRIFWVGYYSGDLVAVLDRHLLPGMTFVDIGANIGEVTLVAARRVTRTGRVISFEPMPDKLRALRSNLAQNHVGNVATHELALGNADDRFPLYLDCGQGARGDEHEGLGSLYQGTPSQQPVAWVRVTRLDGFLERNPVERLDFMKIDIEGSELPCLLGALSSIRRHLPKIIVEVQSHSARIAGHDPADILDLLSPLGYQFFRIEARGELRAITRDSLRAFQNVLCLPPPARTGTPAPG